MLNDMARASRRACGVRLRGRVADGACVLSPRSTHTATLEPPPPAPLASARLLAAGGGRNNAPNNNQSNKHAACQALSPRHAL